MTWQIDHLPPITNQELVDTIVALYAAFFYTGNKSDIQFDAFDLAHIAMVRAKKIGLTVNCELKDPDPPKIDLPLFNVLE